MTAALPFVPTITPHAVDVARCYDYGPSICGARMWWCSGLGTDTIVSAPVPGHPGRKGAPWHIPGRLVADPCAVNIGHLTLVLFTVGMPDGRNNGTGWAIWSAPQKPPIRHGMLIAHASGAGYGHGQPAIAHGAPGTLLVHRTDGPNGENLLAAWRLDIDDVDMGAPPILGEPVPFDAPEDGASPEAWWTPDGRLAVMLSGGGYCGVRTYRVDGAMLHRQRELETGAPTPTGGRFWSQAPARATGTVDGLGVERDEHHRPVLTGGRLHFWQAQGDPTSPGTWALRRRSYRPPEGTA